MNDRGLYIFKSCNIINDKWCSGGSGSLETRNRNLKFKSEQQQSGKLFYSSVVLGTEKKFVAKKYPLGDKF